MPKSWSRTVLWRPTRPFRANTQKKCPFHYRGLECKSRKSRNTWSNRQIWPWSTEWSRAKANRALPKEHTGHSKHPLPTTQEKTLHMDITRWSTWKSDWLYTHKVSKIYCYVIGIWNHKFFMWCQFCRWKEGRGINSGNPFTKVKLFNCEAYLGCAWSF